MTTIPTIPNVNEFADLLRAASRFPRPDRPAKKLLSEGFGRQGPNAFTEEDVRRVRASLKLCAQDLELAEERVNALKNEQKAYQALIAPIRRLPLDVLQAIFLLVYHTSRRREIGTPPIVAQVSQVWRNLALSTPILWSSVTISPLTRDCGQLVRLYALRAHSLSINTFLRSGGSHFQLQQSENLIQSVVEHRDRVKSLFMTMEPHNPNPFLQLSNILHPEGILPALETIDLTGPTPNKLTVQDELDVVKQLTPLAPNLVSIVLRHVSKLTQTTQEPDMVIQAPSLRIFHGTISKPVTITRLFVDPSKLEVLDILLYPPYNTPHIRRDSAHQSFNSLTSLCLRITDTMQNNDLAHFPSLPALRNLIIYELRRRSSVVDPSSLLLAWGPQLRYLGLMLRTKHKDFVNTFTRCIALVPNIEALLLPTHKLKSITSSLFPLLPRLAHLELWPEFHERDMIRCHVYYKVEKELARPGSSAVYGSLRRLQSFTILCSPIDNFERWVTFEGNLAALGVRAMFRVCPRFDHNATEATCFDTPYFERQGGIFRTVINNLRQKERHYPPSGLLDDLIELEIRV